METGRLRAAAAFSRRNICKVLGGSVSSSSRGGGAGTGSDALAQITVRSGWVASQAAAAALPFPVRGEAKTIVCDKRSEGQHGLLLPHPVSCDAF